MPLTSSQIRRLGHRLGQMDPLDPADLDLLDEFERSFDAAQDEVVRTIREQLRLDPTARRKTRRSIVAKIRRQQTALSRMQDIAGCRLVVEDRARQEEVLERLLDLPWARANVDDRRVRPSHGYRAVHVIVTAAGRPVEIQVRTRLQDQWAQISEKMADRYGLDVKYGGGPRRVRTFLDALSAQIARTEEAVSRVAEWRRYRSMADDRDRDPESEALEADLWEAHSTLVKSLNELLVTL